MNSKTITYFKIAVVEISLWLIFVLQGANLDNVYFLFYLPLLFTACFIFVSPISREKLFNKYVGYFFSFLLSSVTLWKIAIDNKMTVNWSFVVESVLCVFGLTLFF